MNPKIRKVIDEIERTKNKLEELQVLLPELERKRLDMENNEIIRLVRSADIPLADLPEFFKALKQYGIAAIESLFAPAPVFEPSSDETVPESGDINPSTEDSPENSHSYEDNSENVPDDNDSASVQDENTDSTHDPGNDSGEY